MFFSFNILPVIHAQNNGYSLRFYGNGINDIDRVKIKIDAPAMPVDVGAKDFTLEFWMKANPGDNIAADCFTGNDNWIFGSIIFDRDVYGNGDRGDFGISLFRNGVAFGVHNGLSGAGLCGTTNVSDGQWHHIVVTRRQSDGLVSLFVDGVLDAQIDGPDGDVSYRDGRATQFTNDPYLIIGAEKHDVASPVNSYRGWIDEVRLSNTLRYSGNFTRPVQPFIPDANTVALYHFDEGGGDLITDVSGAAGGPSNGVRKYGGSPAGPEWSTDTPFGVGDAISTMTGSGCFKSNQSKVFYHDGQWWTIAYYEAENRWYIWKHNGASWARAVQLRNGPAFRWDVFVNPSAGRLYMMGSHKSIPEFRRYSYVAGAWIQDNGFPVKLYDFTNSDNNNPVSLVRAKNGQLWIFRIHNRTLQAKRSIDGGLSWSTIINLKSGLTTTKGTTDAAAFTSNGLNYIGVAYGEADSVGSRYGFLTHRDIDSKTQWSDESAALTFFGNEHASPSISMTVAHGRIYLFTRNAGGNCQNTLYQRTTAGVWKKYRVNASAGLTWNTPAIAFDDSSDKIYVMGVNARTRSGEFKTCALGQESSLQNAVIKDLFVASGAAFEHLSVPAAKVNSVTGLMICVDNATTGDVWYRHLALTGAPRPALLETEQEPSASSDAGEAVSPFGFFQESFKDQSSLISVHPNPFNSDAVFSFSVGTVGLVKLRIFSLNGQLIRTLVDDELMPGVYGYHWNSRDENGWPVASGTYIYRLDIGSKIAAGRMKLIK